MGLNIVVDSIMKKAIFLCIRSSTTQAAAWLHRINSRIISFLYTPLEVSVYILVFILVSQYSAKRSDFNFPPHCDISVALRFTQCYICTVVIVAVFDFVVSVGFMLSFFERATTLFLGFYSYCCRGWKEEQCVYALFYVLIVILW